jgi:hypothetical protein
MIKNLGFKSKEGTRIVLPMQHKNLFKISMFVVAVLTLSAVAYAQVALLPNYTQTATIVPPNGLPGSFDIAWVDQGSQRYYLADKGSTTLTPGQKSKGRIDVINTQTNTFLYAIPTSSAETGFAGAAPTVTPGCTISGPNGVVAIPQLNQLYVGDGDSTVKVVDLAAKAIVATIPTGGKCRADELAYDPLDHIIMITNPGDSPPFVTFISADTQSVLGTLTYPASQSGLEQPVWNPVTYRFDISVPASPPNLGSVDEIDPIAMKITNSFKITCSPAGLAIGPNQHAMTSCGIVVDARVGNVLAIVSGPSGDEIWYNPGDNNYYFGSTNVAVVNAETNQLVGYITGSGGHSIAVDSNYNNIYVPVTGVGIKVFQPTRK